MNPRTSGLQSMIIRVKLYPRHINIRGNLHPRIIIPGVVVILGVWLASSTDRPPSAPQQVCVTAERKSSTSASGHPVLKLNINFRSYVIIQMSWRFDCDDRHKYLLLITLHYLLHFQLRSILKNVKLQNTLIMY